MFRRALIQLLFVIAMLAFTDIAHAGTPTTQQLEELKQSVCEFYKGRKLVHSEPPAGIAGPDGMVRITHNGNKLEWKTSAPYTVVCNRYTLRKRPEQCFEGSGCFEEARREFKDCNGEVVIVRPPPGSSITFRSSCWHLATKR